MAAVLNLIPINDSPLTTLQKNYSLYQGSGDIWVIRNQEVEAYYGGSPKPPEFIKRPAARLLMQRDLESLSFPCKPKEVIDAFFTDPATTIYGDVAFSPIPITGGSTLNSGGPHH